MLPTVEGLDVQLIRSRRRTIAVEVDHNARVLVRAPTWMAQRDVQRFVSERSDWIQAKVSEARARESIIPRRTAANQVYLRGSLLTWGWQDADVILPRSVPPENAPRWLDTWQRRQAEAVFSAMINECLPPFGVTALRYTGLRVRRMRRRWGSCTRTGLITLNEHLVRTPDLCIRGVVMHELCHLVHMDHGKGFMSLLNEMYSDHRLSTALLNGWTSIVDIAY